MKFNNKPCTYKRISQLYKPKTHKGIDLANSEGTPIYAVASGTVVASSYGAWDKSYGNEVAIYHGSGNYTNYAHLSKITTKVGAKVKAGEKIGEMGSTGNSTGNHLHFELHLGKKWNRVDPKPYMDSIATTKTTTKTASYTVGKTYTLQSNMNVRKSANGTIKKVSEMSADGKKHCTATTGNAVLKKGTKVTVKEVKVDGTTTWVKIPSGWICAKQGSKVYIK